MTSFGKSGWDGLIGREKLMERDMTAGFGLYILDHWGFFLVAKKRTVKHRCDGSCSRCRRIFMRSEYRGSLLCERFYPDILDQKHSLAEVFRSHQLIEPMMRNPEGRAIHNSHRDTAMVTQWDGQGSLSRSTSSDRKALGLPCQCEGVVRGECLGRTDV